MTLSIQENLSDSTNHKNIVKIRHQDHSSVKNLIKNLNDTHNRKMFAYMKNAQLEKIT